MARKKQITLILIILSTLLLAGPGVVDIANAEPISSSIPTDFERQSVPSTLSPSDSIDDGPAQESVKWNLGWNSFDGNWFYVDSVNPVSLHSGWLYTNGAWYWLDPSTHAMAIGLHECNGSAYWFDASGAMATGWVLDGGTGTTRRAPAPSPPVGPTSAAPGTGLIPPPMPWLPAFTSATAPCTGLIRPARWRPGGSSTAAPGTTRLAPARWRAAPFPSAACPTASTPGRGPC